MRYSNFSFKKVNWLLLMLFAIGLSFPSCKNKDSKSETKTDSTNVTPKSENHDFAPGTKIPFATLRLDSASLATLLSSNQVKKIIVQSIDPDGTSAGMSLVGYGAGQHNNILTGPVQFTVLTNPVTTFDYPVIMGDQELTLKVIKDILALPHAGGKIKPSDLVSLKFVPQKDGFNHLFYTVTGITGGIGNGSTNPSPPATPCENDCDW